MEKTNVLAMLLIAGISAASYAAADPVELPLAYYRWRANFDRLERIEYEFEGCYFAEYHDSYVNTEDFPPYLPMGPITNAGQLMLDVQTSEFRRDYWTHFPSQSTPDIIQQSYVEGWWHSVNKREGTFYAGVSSTDWQYGNRLTLGHALGHDLGQSRSEMQSLADAVEQRLCKSVEPIGSTGVRLFAYGNPVQKDIRCDFEIWFDPEKDWMITKLLKIVIKPDESKFIITHLECRDFQKIDGFWIPLTLINHCQLRINPASVRINQPFSKTMELAFPDDAWFFDERSGESRQPKAADIREDATKADSSTELLAAKRTKIDNPAKPFRFGWAAIMFGAGSMVLLLVFMVMRRGRLLCMLIAVCMFGCKPTTTPAVRSGEAINLGEDPSLTFSTDVDATSGLRPAVDPSANADHLRLVNPEMLEVVFQSMGTEMKSELRFVNISDQTILLQNQLLRPSCGCINAEWNTDEVAPGDETILSAVFSSTQYEPDKQTAIAMTLLDVNEEFLHEQQVVITVRSDAKWRTNHDYLAIRGTQSEFGTASFRILQPPSASKPRFKFPNQDFEVIEARGESSNASWGVTVRTRFRLDNAENHPKATKVVLDSVSSDAIPMKIRYQIERGLKLQPTVLVMTAGEESSFSANLLEDWRLLDVTTDKKSQLQVNQERLSDSEFRFQVKTDRMMEAASLVPITIRYQAPNEEFFDAELPIVFVHKDH